MKIIYIAAFTVSLIMTISGCGNSKTKENSAAGQATEIKTTDSGNFAVYHALPILKTPILFSMDLLNSFADYKPLSKEDYHSLTDIGAMRAVYDSIARAAQLPPKENLRFAVTEHIGFGGKIIMELYSLSDDLQPLDKLQLYSVEEVNGGKNSIVQTFEIDVDYEVRVFKHLNNVLIEKLTYRPTPEGIFEEVRNGKTVTVAFDSYDHINYYIQTFIWNRNTKGDVQQKMLKRDQYRLMKDAKFVRVASPQADKEPIQLSILPREFRTVPDQVKLTITNNTSKTLQFGAEYQIDKLVNGEWVNQELPDVAFISIMYMLQPGDTASYDLSLYPDRIDYTAGEYRIRKQIIIGEESAAHVAAFVIV